MNSIEHFPAPPTMKHFPTPPMDHFPTPPPTSLPNTGSYQPPPPTSLPNTYQLRPVAPQPRDTYHVTPDQYPPPNNTSSPLYDVYYVYGQDHDNVRVIVPDTNLSPLPPISAILLANNGGNSYIPGI